MSGSFGQFDPVDPVRRRILQGAVGTAFSLVLPRAHHKTGFGRSPGSASISVNQVGFLPQERKRAVIASTDVIRGGRFQIVKNSNRSFVCYAGGLSEYANVDADDSGDALRYFYADFDGFSQPGVYRIALSDGQVSVPFTVANNVYHPLAPLVLRYFHLQRCGSQADPARSACHNDDGVIEGGPRDGEPIDASGGWHDAGDYLKFVETTSYVTALMLFAYERISSGRRSPFSSVQPGLGNAVAGAGHGASEKREEGRGKRQEIAVDHSAGAGTAAFAASLLLEARVGVEWLLRMHPSPDEFYYQVGSEDDHDTWRLPEDDCADRNAAWRPRKVLFGVGANLAGRCAVSFAMASRFFRDSDAKFAAQCGRAAESVFALGMASQQALSTRPSSFYPEKTWEDDMEWGAVELFRTTGSAYYLHLALDFAHLAGAAGQETSVYNTHSLAHFTLYKHAPRSERDRLLQYLRDDADLVRNRARNAYGLATPYVWGTAEAAVGGALNCLLFSELSRHDDSIELARKQRDYVLGCNPFDMSFVIGVGSRYPHYPHHQIANIKRIELTGALVGGPTNTSILSEEAIDLTTPGFATMNIGPVPTDDSDQDDCVYHDCAQDYVSNEPANDYTAKFLLLNTFYC